MPTKSRRVTTVAIVLVVAGCTSDPDQRESAAATGSGGTTNTSGSGASATGSGAGAGTSTGGGDCALTQWEQKMLDAHNEWRELVEPPAKDMYRVYWDSEIAANAAAWVASCDPDWPHSPEDSRSNLGGYDVLGENLSYCGGTACEDDPTVSDGSGKGDGEGWWEERHDYDWATDSSSGVTSHYTQMVSSNVYAIGCATQRCDAPGPFGWDGEWWWTICQYGPRGQAYWVGNKPYESGSGGLVEPPEQVFADHAGLCR
ncbi:MAG: CAP domain-containing protein [Polyangiaceae bacterium]